MNTANTLSVDSLFRHALITIKKRFALFTISALSLGMITELVQHGASALQTYSVVFSGIIAALMSIVAALAYYIIATQSQVTSEIGSRFIRLLPRFIALIIRLFFVMFTWVWFIGIYLLIFGLLASGTMALIGGVMIVVGLILNLFLLPRYVIAPAILVVEECPVSTAVSKSVTASHGKRRRIFGLVIVTTFAAGIVSWLLLMIVTPILDYGSLVPQIVLGSLPSQISSIITIVLYTELAFLVMSKKKA